MSETPLSADDDAGRPSNGERLVHQEVKYEDADVGVRGIAAVLLGIAFVFVGTGLVAWFFLNANESDADRIAQKTQYSEPADKLPAAPRLEPLDRAASTNASDVFAHQIAMERDLHKYGETGEKGFVHIPIERAMKLVIETIPVRKEAARPPAKGFGLVGGGESSAGREFSEGPAWLRQK